MSKKPIHVPRLAFVRSDPLNSLEQVIFENKSTIEAWFKDNWDKTPAPITSSVDLRHAGFKLAPVDTNLFPAGFNNLDFNVHPLDIKAIQLAIQSRVPGCRNILILPENHTRNRFYLESLAVLKDSLVKAGFVVRIGSLDESMITSQEFILNDDRVLLIEPVIREGTTLSVADFSPCFLLLNNDLSSGIPSLLTGITQRIEPTANLGWSSRQKSSHFDYYNAVVSDFCAQLPLDSWLLNPLFSVVDGVDFMSKTGLEALAEAVDALLAKITDKYVMYKIDNKPFVAVKADNGTYGMNVLMVSSGADLLQLNRKQRTKMASGKSGHTVRRLMIQEGINSIETTEDGSVTEPVIYMMGSTVIGGFFRAHSAKSTRDNLNSPGMYFESMAFSPQTMGLEEHSVNRFYIYSVVARLAALAAAREIDASVGALL